MTGNLLAHSDLFRAGIARSGAYNRTLTPFGFQSERRTLWEAPETYLKMSPFMHAHKINEPLLLIHGTADDNVYFRHTLRLTEALFRAGKDAEVLPLSGLTHLVPDPVVTERRWTRTAQHFQKHLGRPR